MCVLCQKQRQQQRQRQRQRQIQTEMKRKRKEGGAPPVVPCGGAMSKSTPCSTCRKTASSLKLISNDERARTNRPLPLLTQHHTHTRTRVRACARAHTHTHTQPGSLLPTVLQTHIHTRAPTHTAKPVQYLMHARQHYYAAVSTWSTSCTPAPAAWRTISPRVYACVCGAYV